MTNDPNDQHNMDDLNPDVNEAGTGDSVPVDAPLEVEPPRRAASAQFVVEGDVGSEAALREAMDPANQSLADALRLSFRVLQLVILVLILLFFMSGFQTVGENQSGVLTRFGKIVPVAGQEALEPGLKFSFLPYPAGEFVIFDVENRSADLRVHRGGQWREAFWPDLGGRSLEQATEAATVTDPLRPERTGYVLTRDGDIAHVRLSASYQIDNPVQFVQSVRHRDTDTLVRLALQRAAVHVASRMSLQELVDLSDELRQGVQAFAQQVLDDSQMGITIGNVSVSNTSAPLAIRNAFGEVQSAQVQSEREIENARRRANQRLVNSAGERYRDVIRLINRYEDALQVGQEDRAATLLAEINTLLDSDSVSGEVAFIIHEARSYRAVVEASLGHEARRFASLLPAFRENPELVVRQRWLHTYANVLKKQDAEVFFVPHTAGMFNMQLAGLHQIKELRQQLQLDRRERESFERSLEGMQQYIPWADDIQLEGPGRQLRRDGGRVQPRRQPGRD